MTKRGRKLKTYEYEGQTYNLAELADLAELTPAGMYARLRYYGYSVETAVERARMKGGRPSRTFTHAGRTHTLLEWSRIVGISDKLLDGRLRKGWTLEQALSIPSIDQRRRGMASTLDRAAEGQTDRLDLADWPKGPGVPPDLGPLVGTGAGSTARETPNITFPQKAEAE